MTTFKINQKFLTVSGKRIGVYISAGPWVPGVDPTTIKIRPKTLYSFPPEVKTLFAVENNTDIQTDYFEKDCIVLTSGHPLYQQVRQAI